MARRKPKKKLPTIIVVVLLLLVCSIGGLATAWLKPYKNYAESPKFIWIPRGATSYQIAHQLQTEGVVRHWTLFLSYLKIIKRSSALQAGEYQFEGSLTVPEIADKLIRGLVFYHQITVPEGYSLFDIADLLEEKGFCTAQAFRAAAAHVNLVSDLVQNAKNLEGFLFPDTYRLTRTATADEIVQWMVDRFRQVYTNYFESEARKSSLSLKEIVTLASLIEKETGLDEERELVSAVFHNRLRKRIPLQCDPTVIYAAKLMGRFRGEIYRSDLELNSPYNTYRHSGLPPSPIANPGLKSIQAALRPAQVDYLYFVSDSNGSHIFSSTLAQHNRAVTAYRRALRQGLRQDNQARPGPS